MRIELTERQGEARESFRTFADEVVAPLADEMDAREATPPALVARFGREGFLGAVLPAEFGGRGMDMITYGLLNEEVGRACSSLRSLLTVHNMVAHALLKWGTRAQRERWLPGLAAGTTVAAFALSEPNVGSDARSVETTAQERGDAYVLDGRKKWTTYGQLADVFLVFARAAAGPTAFLVERSRPGLAVAPISGMLGTRASMLAELHFGGCEVPKENVVCRPGFGFSHVASTALDQGRYSVASGCVGLAQACLEASLAYTSARRQFGVPLSEHQLVRRMITDMVTGVKAARLLCQRAGYLKDAGDPSALMETSIAKYFASTAAARAAADAVQIHGANGCSSDYPVQRYLRDARVMEIIEGSTQMQQVTIAGYGYEEFSAGRGRQSAARAAAAVVSEARRAFQGGAVDVAD